MKEKSLVKYSKKIIEAYEKNIFFLSVYKTGHFFTRAFKVTKDKKYYQILAQFICVYKPLDTSRVVATIERGLFTYKTKENLFQVRNQRRREHLVFYLKHPKMKFYIDLLQYFIYLNKFSVGKKVFSKDYEKLMKLLKREDFKKLFFTIEAMGTNASYIFNSIFVLKNLGICDLTDEAIKFYKDMYLTRDLQLKKKLSKKEFISLVYGLTHIVIAASDYYEHTVRRELWIMDFFNKNLDRIIKETDLDVIAEVGLCIKLFGKEHKFKKENRKIISYLKRNFSFNKLKNTAFLLKKEHTCSILMLLFSGRKKFYPGPNLLTSEVFKKYNAL